VPRRNALLAIIVAGGALTVVGGALVLCGAGVAASSGDDEVDFQSIDKKSLEVQREYGWNFGAITENLVFDGVTLSAFGWTGLLLGFVSIYLMHAVARHRFGARAAWYGVFVVFGLVSAGIYLGRVMRWNSWDLIVQPGRRIAELAAHMTDPGAVARATAITLVCAAALTVAYFVFYVLVGVRLNPERYRR